MTQQHANERETTVDTSPSPAAVSLLCGAIGTAVGARRGVRGAAAGGFVAGTVGYLATAVAGAGTDTAPSADDPISIDIESQGTESVEGTDGPTE
ncbi:hypothetical protein [Halovenus marina]|uniref:hypothetical protein n=1 Tax=Halovenus marina TaxID=3396621 RepID=UPI003F55BFB9